MFENENFLFFLSAKWIRDTEDIYSSAYQYELWSRGITTGETVWVSLKDRIPIRILGTRSSRRLSVLSMFNSGGEEENGTVVFFFRTLSMMGGIGIFVGGFILFLLVGSVALILY